MLKALELHGFKSFADRTRFEFPEGITVVVGPNGSGKSNVVDAIKWVLGEQSAKSLRGKEMADVIFKGSGQSGRKPMNTAEATLVLDNASRSLPIDAPEVHITRRVYRSGEGEYLINRQPARLKDIKDLFRGTGVGGDAYSLIEQGKVDRLLQASAKDRRAMFEEAAGISRFKAKKVEAQRRLERVDQNLLRLRDIVEEVENRLKTVRSQAGKARRYREYSERLQQLRTQIALVDWRRLTERLGGIEAELAAASEQSHTFSAEEERLEDSQLELEAAAASAGEELRNSETRLAFTEQQISQQQSVIAHGGSRTHELEDEARQHQRNLLAMTDKVGDVRARLKSTQAEVAAAQAAHQRAEAAAGTREARLAELNAQHDTARQQAEGRRKEYVRQLQAAATLASQVEAGESQLAGVQQAVMQFQQQLTMLAETQRGFAEHLATAQEKEQSLSRAAAAHAERIEAAVAELAENRNLYSSRAEDLAQLHTRRQGVAERAEILEEFERTLEGIGTGVRQVLARAGVRSQERGAGNQEWSARGYDAETKAQGAWSLVRGVVADFVQVGVDHAAAMDAALGELAQAVIFVGGPADIQQLVAAASDLTGRVVVVGSDAEPSAPAIPTSFGAEAAGPGPQHVSISRAAPIELTAEVVAGIDVIGRADKLSQAAEGWLPLAVQLLGSTFVVRTLDDALRLRARAPRGTRVVTLAGELVDEWGAVAFGPRQAATSLVSRRSQLRAARQDLAVLDQQIVEAHRETLHLKREIERHELSMRELQETARAIEQQLVAERAASRALEEQASRTRHEQQAAQAGLADANRKCGGIETTLKHVSQQLALAQSTAEATQAAIASQEEELAIFDRQRGEASAQLTTAKVELARSEQRLEGLKLRLSQFEDDSRERERGINQVRQQLRQADDRREAAVLTVLAATAQIASLALLKESLKRQMADCAGRRDLALSERTQAAERLNSLRRKLQKLRDQQHQLQLSAEQVRHERRTLEDRLREDYGLELAQLTHEPSAEEAEQRLAVEEEIESLRRKINQIGAVNLDALDELDELEQRFGTLSNQFNDLTEAKQSLERIIHKINADSRRLFLETLEAIRVNFQALYRKAFGGGKADILLEEGVDVLECGVEIMATPPGKPSFNNSLLSGGEKALTAVALLLAIFQFRPSPFCVLDEVDAPFDEANIGRFVDVLKDFLSWTRFIIVTHSKKTMTAATTLYGVTMQESGVSKRVSVRFDDVTDDGHIRSEALDRAATDDASAAEHAA